MNLSAFRNFSIPTKILFSACIVIASFIFFLFVGLLFAIPLFDKSLIELFRVLQTSSLENIQELKYFQIVQSLGIFIIPPIIISWLFVGNISESLSLQKKPKWISLLLVILILFCSIPIINYLSEWNSSLKLPTSLSWLEESMKNMEKAAEKITKMFLVTNNTSDFFVNILMIAIIPALGEELMFRGLIQNSISRITKNYHLGIFLSAILFSAIHMQFYGFIPRMLFGVLFGYFLVWSGSLWLPIIGHLINNGTAVVFYFIASNKQVEIDLENIGKTHETLIWVICSSVLVILLLWQLYKNEKNSKKKSVINR